MAHKYIQRTQLNFVSIWRPTNGTVQDWPIGFCDTATLNPNTDIIAADRVSRQYVGEIYYVKYNVNQRWYWLSEQDINEVLMFVSFDSEADFGQACKLLGFIYWRSRILAKKRWL